jgi:hypothetical protein
LVCRLQLRGLFSRQFRRGAPDDLTEFCGNVEVMCMYVYLDQSDLSRLGDLKSGDSVRNEIIKLFNDTGTTLVMSYGHATESAPLDFQTTGKRDAFIGEIKSKKIIKQFVDLVSEEILHLGKTPNPFYDSYHKNAGVAPSASDSFGYFESSVGAKKHISDSEKDNKKLSQARVKTLNFQRHEKLSRKETFNRYFNYVRDNKFMEFFPRGINGNERESIRQKIIGRELILPTYETYIRILTERNIDTKRPPKESDAEDLLSHSPSLVYCDLFTTDKDFADIVLKASKHKASLSWCPCYSFRSPEGLLKILRENIFKGKTC